MSVINNHFFDHWKRIFYVGKMLERKSKYMAPSPLTEDLVPFSDTPTLPLSRTLSLICRVGTRLPMLADESLAVGSNSTMGSFSMFFFKSPVFNFFSLFLYLGSNVITGNVEEGGVLEAEAKSSLPLSRLALHHICKRK
jgi:hypothetical protein